MKIHYKDEYGEELYIAYNQSVVPRVAETVIIHREEYKVKDVIWFVEDDIALVEITQNLTRQPKKDGSNSALAGMKAEISEIKESVNRQERKRRLLGEQVSSIASHINRHSRQERKDNDTR